MPRTGENIYKRKDGRWEGRFLKEYSAGKSHYGYVYGKSHKEAKTKLLQAQAKWSEKHSKAVSEKEDEMLSSLADCWIECHKSFFKESTLVKYQNLLRCYILPELGGCHISEINHDKLIIFSYRLLDCGGVKGRGLSPKTVSDCLALLRSIQKYAANKNMDVKNISCCVPVRRSQKQLRVFSIQEQQQLCEYLKNNMTLSNLGILLCLFTGLRIGELCALKWKDISFTEKTIYVHQTMQRLHTDDSNDTRKTKILISTPKSQCSIRIVPLPDIVMNEIASVYQSADSYFLTGEKGKFLEPRTMQNRFKKVLRECGIANANFHTLRHTFATRCVEVGFDIKSLSEILGHANVNITLNRYVHPTMELKRENMSKLSERFSVK